MKLQKKLAIAIVILIVIIAVIAGAYRQINKVEEAKNSKYDNELLVINKVDSQGNPMQGVKFKIDSDENLRIQQKHWVNGYSSLMVSSRDLAAIQEYDQEMDNYFSYYAKKGYTYASKPYLEFFESGLDGNMYIDGVSYHYTDQRISYFEIDLTNHPAEYELTVNAQMNETQADAIGFATISTSLNAPNAYDTVGQFIKLTEPTAAKDYTITLLGGRKYYLYVGYSYSHENLDPANNNYGKDTDNTFTINDIHIEGKTYETDSNGQIKLWAPAGSQVNIKEVETLPGYRLKEDMDSIIMRSGRKNTLTIVNYKDNETEPTQGIKDVVIDVIKEDGSPIENAQVKVTDSVGINTYTTNANGEIQIQANYHEKMTVEQISTQEGYSLSDENPIAYIVQRDNNEITIVNYQGGQGGQGSQGGQGTSGQKTLRVTKVNEDGQPLEGVKFNIFGAESSAGSNTVSIGTIQSASSSYFYSSAFILKNSGGVENKGYSYEIKDKYGLPSSNGNYYNPYNPNPGTYHSWFKIDLSNNTENATLTVNTSINLVNASTYAIVTESTTRPGASAAGKMLYQHNSGTSLNNQDYSVTLEPGKVYYLHFVFANNSSTSCTVDINSIKIESIKQYITDANGQFDVEVNSGETIYLTEVETLSDYILDTNPVEYTATTDNLQNLTITNYRKEHIGETRDVTIKKVNDGGDPLDGVEFSVSEDNLGIDHIVTSNANISGSNRVRGFSIKRTNTTGTASRYYNSSLNDYYAYGVNENNSVNINSDHYYIARGSRVNGSGIDNFTSWAYWPIDLTGKGLDYELVINAEISSQQNSDYGYITITNTPDMPNLSSTQGQLAKISGNISATDYKTTLSGGSKYYLHVNYVKDASGKAGSDTFKINALVLRAKSYTTDANGEIHVNLPVGKTVNIGERKAKEGYTMPSNPKTTYTVDASNNNLVTIVNPRALYTIKTSALKYAGVTTWGYPVNIDAGTISGDGNAFYEKVYATTSNKKDIVVTPKEGWIVKQITVNGTPIDFTPDENGVVTLPAGYFTNVNENKTIVASFDKTIEITKVDEAGNKVPGATFGVYKKGPDTYDTEDPYIDKKNGFTFIDNPRVAEIKANYPEFYYGDYDNCDNHSYGYYSKKYVSYESWPLSNEWGNVTSNYICGWWNIDLSDRADTYRLTINVTTKPTYTTGYYYGPPTNIYARNCEWWATIIPANSDGSAPYAYAEHWNDRGTISSSTIKNMPSSTTGNVFMYRKTKSSDPAVTNVNNLIVTNDYSVDLTGGENYWLYVCGNLQDMSPYGVYCIVNDMELERTGGSSTNSGPNFELIGTYTTDANGKFDFPLEGQSDIYIKEISAPTGYVVSDDSYQKIDINRSNLTIVDQRSSGVFVHHLLKGTDKKVAADQYMPYLPGETYTTSAKTLDKLHVVGTPENATGDYKDEPIDVYYYYEADPMDITIHHYLAGTTDKLVEDATVSVVPEVTVNNDTTYQVSNSVNYELKKNEDYLGLIDLYILDSIECVVKDNISINDTLEINTPGTEITYYYRTSTRTAYTVEYYYNDVKDNSKTDLFRATIGNVINSYTDKPVAGYKFDRVEPTDATGAVSLTISDVPTNNVIKVYYVTDDTQTKDLSYTVEYYKDNVKVDDDTQTVTTTVQLLQPDTLTVDTASINTVDKYPGYVLDITDPNPIPTTVNNGDVIKVYYVKDYIGYSIEYYYNNVKDDSKTETGTALLDSTIDDYIDKTETGYKFDRVENKPLVITAVPENNVMKVYYVADENQTKNLGYTIEYYKDGVKQEVDTVHIAVTVQLLQPDTIHVIRRLVNTTNMYDGYRCESTDPNPVPTTVNNGDVIKVYYVKDNFDYTVEYYYDGVIDDSKTETASASLGTVIDTYTDKNIDGYKLDHVTPVDAAGGVSLTISATPTDNVIRVYYVKDNFNYTVEYYYNGVIDNSKTDTLSAEFGSQITSYTNKAIDGYKFEKTENFPLTIKVNEQENVIKVYYVTDDTQTKDLSYTVEYYKDGEKQDNDTQTVTSTVQLLQPNTLLVDISQINTTNKYEGYKLDAQATGIIPTVVNNGYIIKVFYVRDNFDYTVEYYYDGIIDNSKTDTLSALFNSQITTYTDKNIDGYKLDHVTPVDATGSVSLTISATPANNVIRVYYVKDNIDYTVEYYYDGVRDDSKTDTDSAEFGSQITAYTDKNIPGYRFDRTENLPLTISATPANNVIRVYYVNNCYDYKVEYYYDGVIDNSKTETANAERDSIIRTYTDKNITGYKLDRTENLPLTITDNVAENVIKVYYVKDVFAYSIEYFYDGVKDDNETINNTAVFGTVIDTYPDKNRTGYKLADINNKPLVVTEDASANVMRIYYVKDNFEYTVRYYYDGVEDESKLERTNATYGDVITTYTDKNITGYKLDHVTPVDAAGDLSLTITNRPSDNVIRVYYVKDSYAYTVEYYYDGIIDNSKTATGTALYNDVIDTYEDKNITGYKFVRDEGKPLTISTIAANNVIKVYYEKDNFNYTVNYFYDGTQDTSKTETKSAVFESQISTYTDKNIRGYKLEKVEVPSSNNNRLPLIVSATESENIINVYYVKDNFAYTVEYYYDGTIDDTKTEHKTATYQDVIRSYTDNRITGYVLDRTEPDVDTTGLVITDVAANNVLRVYYIRQDANVIVKYIDKETGDNLAAEETISGQYNDPYTTSAKDINNYYLDSIDGNPSGNMGLDTITVTYYYVRYRNLTIKYVDKFTDTEISTRVEETGKKKTDTYDASENEKTINGYTLIERPNPMTGSFDTDKELTFFYALNTNVIVRYVDKDGNALTQTDPATGNEVDPTIILPGYQGQTYDITNTSKEFDGYVLISEPADSDKTGTYGREDKEFVYVYARVADVVVKYVDKYTDEEIETPVTVDGYEGKSFDISDKVKEIPGYTLIEEPTVKTGNMTVTEQVFIYYYAINSNVIVKYVDQDDNEIHEQVVKPGYQGLEFNINGDKLDIDGYVLIEEPEEKTGVYTRVDQIFIFKYAKVTKVIVTYLDKETGKVISELNEYVLNGYVGKAYETEQKEFKGYTFVESTGKTKGTMTENTIRVTYYYIQDKPRPQEPTQDPTPYTAPTPKVRTIRHGSGRTSGTLPQTGESPMIVIATLIAGLYMVVSFIKLKFVDIKIKRSMKK